jgi:hypothetical protein
MTNMGVVHVPVIGGHFLGIKIKHKKNKAFPARTI